MFSAVSMSRAASGREISRDKEHERGHGHAPHGHGHERPQDEQARRAGEAGVKRLSAHGSFIMENSGVRYWVWYTMENPNFSSLSKIWSTLVMATILVSSASFITLSLPEFYQEPPVIFEILEIICVVIFTIEYVARLVSMPSFPPKADDTGDGETPPAEKVETWFIYFKMRLIFMKKLMNMVDLMAILPFYIETIVNAVNPGGGDSGASSLSVIRIIRIARVFRLLKLGKHNEGLEILVLTMKASWSFLVSVMFLVVILQVLFGSLIFYAETGSLDCVQSFSCMGGPDDGRECTLLELPVVGTNETVHEMWSSVAFASKTASGQPPTENGSVPVVRLPLGSKADPLQCGGESECVSVGNICFMTDGSVTLFNSIPITMWWALVTMCCVGFGDLRPVTTLGQFIGAFTAITGVIVLAMPTTVIGTNFSDIYDSYYEAKEKQELSEQEEEYAKSDEALHKDQDAEFDRQDSVLGLTAVSSSVDSNSDKNGDIDMFKGDKDEAPHKVMRRELQKSKERDDEVLTLVKKWSTDVSLDTSEWEQLKARALLAGMIKMEELGEVPGHGPTGM